MLRILKDSLSLTKKEETKRNGGAYFCIKLIKLLTRLYDKYLQNISA